MHSLNAHAGRDTDINEHMDSMTACYVHTSSKCITLNIVHRGLLSCNAQHESSSVKVGICIIFICKPALV